jgi:hypothetical protein
MPQCPAHFWGSWVGMIGVAVGNSQTSAKRSGRRAAVVRGWNRSCRRQLPHVRAADDGWCCGGSLVCHNVRPTSGGVGSA